MFENKEIEIVKSEIENNSDSNLSGNRYIDALTGFASSANNHYEVPLNLNNELVKNPASTFFARIKGESLSEEGFDDGDLLIIDKSIDPYDGSIAVCYIEDDFTIRAIKIEEGVIWLISINKNCKPIKIEGENNSVIWGVVSYVIKKM